MTDQIPPPPGLPVEHRFLTTTSVHVATLLSTMGAEPYNIHLTGQRTPQGDAQVGFSFHHTPQAEEAMLLFQTAPHADAKAWEAMSKEDRKMVIEFLHAFAGNIRHFTALAKKHGGRR